MSTAPARGRRPKADFTVEQYLFLERSSEERHEYVDGEILAMAGESPEHGDITVNIVYHLTGQLRGTPCRVRTKDTKVRSGLGLTPRKSVSGMFSYPDVVVVCGEPEYFDEHRDVLTNPKVIVEVLSPSTEAFDRGDKTQRYRAWNPSLTDYLLVAQNRPFIQHFSRQADGKWLMDECTSLDATVAIASIGCMLKLADVYERVQFEQDSEESL